jgi:hypothetical protein
MTNNNTLKTKELAPTATTETTFMLQDRQMQELVETESIRVALTQLVKNNNKMFIGTNASKTSTVRQG